MRKTVLLGSVAVPALAADPRPARAADQPAELRIEVIQGLFTDVPPAMIKILGGPLREILTRNAGVTADMALAPDLKTLGDRLKDNKAQLGVFHGYEFAWAKKHNPDLIPLVVTVYSTGRPQACVVVRADNKATSLADLKGAEVLVPRGTRGHCTLYLDKQRDGLADTTAAPQAKPPVTAEEALDAVVGGEEAAALVDGSALAGYQALQPGAFKKLRVLCQSDRFPQNVIAYHKGAITEETAARVRKVLVESHETPTGKPLMMLWNIKQFAAAPADYGDQLDACLKAYPPPAAKSAPAPADGNGR